MSKAEVSRALFKQRLSAAAAELLGLFERTIAEYEEELWRLRENNQRQHTLLDTVLNPEVHLHRTDVHKLLMVRKEEEEEVPYKQQSKPPPPPPPPPPPIKQEVEEEDPPSPSPSTNEEEPWPNQEEAGEKADNITNFFFNPKLYRHQCEDDREVTRQQQPRANNSTEHLNLRINDKLWTNQKGGEKQFEVGNVTKVLLTSVTVKKEEEEEEEDGEKVNCSPWKQPTSSQPHKQLHTEQPLIMKTKSPSSLPPQMKKKCPFSQPHKLYTEQPLIKAEPLSSQQHYKLHTTQIHTGVDGENREDGNDFRGTQPRKKHSHSDTHSHFQTENGTLLSSECDTDDSGDWEAASGLKPGSNPAQKRKKKPPNNNDLMEFDINGKKYKSSTTAASYSECATSSSHTQKPKFKDKTENFNSKNVTRCGSTADKYTFVCHICGKRLKGRGRSRVQAHMRTHTGEKPFACPVCGRRFQQNAHLTVHVRTHTGEKPYSCEFCPKMFKRSGDLSDHTAVHTRDKRHRCNQCEQRFVWSSALRRHKLSEHHQL